MNFSSPLQSHLKTNYIKRLLTTKEFRYLILILYHISNSRSNKLENFERWERDYFHNSLVLHFSYNCWIHYVILPDRFKVTNKIAKTSHKLKNKQVNVYQPQTHNHLSLNPSLQQQWDQPWSWHYHTHICHEEKLQLLLVVIGSYLDQDHLPKMKTNNEQVCPPYQKHAYADFWC